MGNSGRCFNFIDSFVVGSIVTAENEQGKREIGFLRSGNRIGIVESRVREKEQIRDKNFLGSSDNLSEKYSMNLYIFSPSQMSF